MASLEQAVTVFSPTQEQLTAQLELLVTACYNVAVELEHLGELEKALQAYRDALRQVLRDFLSVGLFRTLLFSTPLTASLCQPPSRHCV